MDTGKPADKELDFNGTEYNLLELLRRKDSQGLRRCFKKMLKDANSPETSDTSIKHSDRRIEPQL